MHLSVVLLMFSLVSVCSWAHRSYTDTRPRKRSNGDTRPYKRSNGDTCDPQNRCELKGGFKSREISVCRSTTCAYNLTNALLSITYDIGNGNIHPAVSSHIDVNAFGTYLHLHEINIYEADYSNITFTLDAADKRVSLLEMGSKDCNVSGFWQNSNKADIYCSSSDLILEGKENSSLAWLDVKDSEATVTVVNSSVEKIWIQNSSLTLDIISSNNIILNIANCIIPERVILSHLNKNITAQDQKECDQKLVHPYTTTTTTSTTTTTTPPTTTTTQAAHSLQSLPFGYLSVTLIFYLLY